MSLNLKPYQWNWAEITAGSTYPASQIAETASDYPNALSRVRVTIKDENDIVFTVLDSASGGVVINTATAGAWDFTIGAFLAPTVAGLYSVAVEWVDAQNIIFCETNGTWKILEK